MRHVGNTACIILPEINVEMWHTFTYLYSIHTFIYFFSDDSGAQKLKLKLRISRKILYKNCRDPK